MLNVHHIRGNTFAFETQLALLPFYKLNEREIILLDSGFASTDRQALTDTLQAYDFCVRGILCSHAHMDHAGNIGHLCSIYGWRVGAHQYEAAIAAPDSDQRQFGIHASSKHGLEECFTTTDVIQPGQATLEFCGAVFGILHLPGHSDGHLGYVTPDDVAYLGDVIMGFSQLEGSKMPFTSRLADDLNSKRSLLQLQAKAYVVAHKAVLTDIRPLTEANIACLQTKVEEIYNILQGTPTALEWLTTYCWEKGWTFRTERSFSILSFGFNSAVDYLEENGRIGSRQVGCSRRFIRRS
jgi:glyoxylase-like metal-dependent hydrolase (beta-lactamase superfamily II)